MYLQCLMSLADYTVRTSPASTEIHGSLQIALLGKSLSSNVFICVQGRNIKGHMRHNVEHIWEARRGLPAKRVF